MLVNSSLTLDPGSAGQVKFLAANNGSVQIAAGVAPLIPFGAAINVGAANLTFLGNNSAINATGTSNISITSGGANQDLHIIGPAGGTAHITTASATLPSSLLMVSACSMTAPFPATPPPLI